MTRLNVLFLSAPLLLAGCKGEHRDEVIDGVVLPDVEFNRFSKNIQHIKHSRQSLVPGNKWVYEAKTPAGIERTTVEVPDADREFPGATAVMVTSLVKLDDVVKRESKDWFAQDNTGATWLFGRETCAYEGGVCDAEGTWEWSGGDARPGIVLPGNPDVGDEPFYETYWKDNIEDFNEILALDATVTVPGGTFNDCWKIRHSSKLDPGREVIKYYCQIVGVALIEDGDIRVELMDFDGV